MGDALAPWHIVILLIVFMVLFGAKRLPGAAKSLGEAMKIFKQETKGLSHDDTAAPATAPFASSTVVTPPPPAHSRRCRRSSRSSSCNGSSTTCRPRQPMPTA